MTNEELISIKHELRLTTQGLATILGSAYATVHRYESGKRDIPQSVEVTLAYILNYYLETNGGFLSISKPKSPRHVRRRKPDEPYTDYIKEMTK